MKEKCSGEVSEMALIPVRKYLWPSKDMSASRPASKTEASVCLTGSSPETDIERRAVATPDSNNRPGIAKPTSLLEP